MVNEGKCEAQVITPDLVGGWKCGEDIGHEGDHGVVLEGHHLNSLKEVDIVVRWKVAEG